MSARVHIFALGDVGATLAMGLLLRGGNTIASLGLYDVNKAAIDRFAFEFNQIALPFSPNAIPPVFAVEEAALFDCDVLVFCASKAVPPVGADIADVRMAQLAGNAAILAPLAKRAREARFGGLLAVVSDPVDLLCQCAYYESNQNAQGDFDGEGLRPEQIRGYGLGVMHARALYYAKRDARFSMYPEQGRAFGPHGAGLIIANSITDYDHALSTALTEQAVKANLYMRALGFKPYIAPALSSGALSILATLEGEWQYSAIFQNGIYWGCKNRLCDGQNQVETLSLPPMLLKWIQTVQEDLWKGGAQWRPKNYNCF